MTGDQLASLRQGAGLSRRDLADALGVNRTTVYRWESGESPIPPAIPLALLAIKIHRQGKGGQRSQMATDTYSAMRTYGVDYDTAARLFGAER